MSILDYKDHLREDGLVGKHFVGEVVQNDDTGAADGLRLGRVRVRVPELFGGIEDDDLPWAPVLRRVQNGALDNASTFHVPDVGSVVVVVFDKGDVYTPLVVGELVGKRTAFRETEGKIFGDDDTGDAAPAGP